MMNRYILILVVGWSSVLCAYGQISLRGRVLDDGGVALRDATVLLYAGNDSLPQQVTETDKRGEYVLKADAVSYTLQVLFMGYEPQERELDLSGISGNYRVPDVVLKKAVRQLGEVNIRGEQLQTSVALEDDKEVYTLASRVKRNAASVFMALTDVPGLDVDLIHNGVSVRGSEGGTLIMVNGIRRDKGYLQVIDPKTIDKVEVHRMPSMRYSSRGIGSIVNITTKVPVRGYSGNVNLTQDPLLQSGSQSISFTGVHEKWSHTASVSNFYMDEEPSKYVYRKTQRSERWDTYKRASYGNSQFRAFMPFASLNMDYTPSKRSFSSLAVRYVCQPQKFDYLYRIQEYTAAGEHNYFGAQQEESSYQSGQISFYHHTKWKNIHTFSVDGDYKFAHSGNDDNYCEMETEGGSPFYRTDRRKREMKMDADAQANMEHKWKKVTLSEGYRFSWHQNDYYNRLNKDVDDLLYKEWNNNVYVDLSGKFHPKWFYRVGANLDITQTSILGHSHVYADVVPKVNLRYNMTPKQFVSIEYKRSRQVPGMTMLNPTPETVDSVRVYQGNPNLLPAYGDKLGLNFYSYKRKVYFYLTLSYSWGEAFSSVSKVNDKGINIITYSRASERRYPYATMDLAWNTTKWLKIGAYVKAGYSMYKDVNENQFNKNLWDMYVAVYGTLTGKRLYGSFRFPITIKQRTLTGYNTVVQDSQFNLAYRLNNSWSLRLDCRYFIPIRENQETDIDGFYEYYRNKPGRTFRAMIGFSYSFRKGKNAGYQQRVKRNYDASTESSVNRY